jgi:hypothetical protein
MARIFETEAYRELPLWVQVLLASRLIRRAVLALPGDDSERPRPLLIEACDALESCARAGQRLKEAKAVLEKAGRIQPPAALRAVAAAMHWAADACHAANDSLDFGAAETACVGSVGRAIAELEDSPGLMPMQLHIYMAADVDQMAFACKEDGVGRYDAVSGHVFGRLLPVIALPKLPAPGPMDGDPTGGAR